MDIKLKSVIYGAILGDLCGRPFEYKFKGELPKASEVDIYNPDSEFSDDTVLTLASCEYLLANEYNLKTYYKRFALDYQDRGFGKRFLEWARMDGAVNGDSFGNGCLMRIAPFMTRRDLGLICRSVNTSHAHPVSIIAALDLYDLYHNEIYQNLLKANTFKVSKKIEPFKEFTAKADDTVDKVRDIFHSTNSTHEAIKLAVSLGGDTDTVASIVGALSAYHYEDISLKDMEYVKHKLDKDLRQILNKL